MIFFDKTRTIGQDANGKNVVWVSVYVDTAANLPAYNAYQTDGFILCMASEGRCIDTGDLYRLDSAGTWQISQAGTGTYTKAEIDALLNAKQNTLTFDAAPTQNSTNPVTSGGVWTDQQRQETEIGVVANAGAKNYCPKETETSTGMGFTADVEVNIPAGTYILSFTGTLAYTASFNAYRALPHSGNSLASINLLAITGAQSVEFTIAEAAKYIAFYHNGNGNSLTNIMIRPAAITDPTFQPYAKTNRELTVENASQQSEINYAINAGAKNLLNFDAWKDVGVTRCTKTISGNSITITSTDNDSFTWYIAESTTVQYPVAARIPVEAGKTYRLSWTASNNNKLNHAIYGNGTTGRPDNVLYRGEGSGYLDYTAASDVTFITFRLGLYVSGKTTTFSNVMIRSAAITDSTFQPYAPTNRELYEMILALQ